VQFFTWDTLGVKGTKKELSLLSILEFNNFCSDVFVDSGRGKLQEALVILLSPKVRVFTMSFIWHFKIVSRRYGIVRVSIVDANIALVWYGRLICKGRLLNKSIIEQSFVKVSESINHSINQPINQSINESIDRSINQSINQSINESINPSTILSIRNK